MRRAAPFLIAILLVALAGWWWLRPAPVLQPTQTPKGVPQTVPSHTASVKTGSVPSPSTALPPETADTLFQQAVSRLAASADGAESRRILAELRAWLDGQAPEQAAQILKAFLATRKDAATKLDVTIQPGGRLGDASSLRVFMLDYLAQVDREAAAVLGRQILSSPSSPDEWAVSLRNVAWSEPGPESHAYLTQKAGELLVNAEWRRNPSAGYLEAFDVIVHAHAVELAPQLTDLVRDRENRALAHAAFLTLDRLTQSDPAATLGQLAADPTLMAGREQTRANFFARGDVRDPQQRELLENYLLDGQRSPAELQTFAGLFPSANYMVSNNLLTSSATPTHAELAERDRAALQTVSGWLNDPRFSSRQAELKTIRERLEKFVAQADSGLR